MPGYIWALVLIGVIGLPATTSVLLYRRAPKVALATGALMLAWLVASALLAAAGVYRQDPAVVAPWIGVAVAGALAVLLAATRIPAVRQALAGPDVPALLAAPQTLRVVGVMFLLALALGRLPALFALPAAFGDIAIGVAAPFVARRLRGGSDRGAVWFNALGIVDHVVAIVIGFLAAVGPTQVFFVTPPTQEIGLLPLVLVPTVAVPFAMALHVVSLARLRGTRKPHVAQGRQTGPSPDPVAR